RAKMMASPGAMNETPPMSAPARPRSRQAQKIASCVEAGPGNRLVERDGVLELVGGQPAPVLDAEFVQESDMGRGASETDDPDAAPLPPDDRERHLLFYVLGHSRGGGAPKGSRDREAERECRRPSEGAAPSVRRC